MLVTRLTPIIGYDMAAKVAQEALKTGKTLKRVVLEKKLIEKEELEQLLDPTKMISPDN